MIRTSRFEITAIEDAIKRIAEHTDRNVDAYLIGGGAMIFYGRKAATKDIDIVLTSQQELEAFMKAAEKAGFTQVPEPGEEYQIIGASTIMQDATGLRLDIFHRRVCDALELTDAMKSRATSHSEHGSLRVHLIAPEDIVLFKGITERETELEDIRVLVEGGIDWAIVEEECLSQSNSGQWANLLLYKLDELRARYGIRPMVDRIRDHADSYVLNETFKLVLLDRELSFKEIQETIQTKSGYSESWTRSKLSLLEKQGFITSRKKGRRKLYRLK